MDCRPGCGACCIALSISTPLPGAPKGKPAGMPCPQLTRDLRCRLFDDPRRPGCCAALRPQPDLCGRDRNDALARLTELEEATRPV
jgi:hypothetical protein